MDTKIEMEIKVEIEIEVEGKVLFRIESLREPVVRVEVEAGMEGGGK